MTTLALTMLGCLAPCPAPSGPPRESVGVVVSVTDQGRGVVKLTIREPGGSPWGREVLAGPFTSVRVIGSHTPVRPDFLGCGDVVRLTERAGRLVAVVVVSAAPDDPPPIPGGPE